LVQIPPPQPISGPETHVSGPFLILAAPANVYQKARPESRNPNRAGSAALSGLSDISPLCCLSDKHGLSCLRYMKDYPVKTPRQLGAILQGYRQDQKLTQKAIGTKVGLAQNVVSLLEAAPERASFGRIFKLLSALDLELVVRPRGSVVRRTEW
jgi:HTH-type transcriptional regulator/antitoxin HipB